MAKNRASRVVFGHEDYDLLTQLAAEVRRLVKVDLPTALGELALNAVEFVLDPVRTGRTTLAELDKIEKTFVGLKIEHFVRDLLDAPKGLRDLVLLGIDVDIKNTVSDSWAWMIPPETIREEGPCLLVASSELQRKSWMGLIVAHPAYLNAPNRDRKCSIKSDAFADVLWLAEGVDWPPDRWAGIDMVRFRDLRKQRASGAARAAAFFRENLGRGTHRNIVLSLLHEQKDPMKRLRGNRGAKDILRPEGIALLSGVYFNPVLQRIGLPRIAIGEHIAIKPSGRALKVLREIGELP